VLGDKNVDGSSEFYRVFVTALDSEDVLRQTTVRRTLDDTDDAKHRLSQ
jgi:hypothetical protein